MHYFVSFLVVNHPEEGERAGCIAILSYGCLVTVNVLRLPHSAVGWSALCDCGIS